VNDNLEKQQDDKKESAGYQIKHFLFHWLAFFGIFAGTVVCPICGQAGCPTGAGSAAIAGGVFALLTQHWRVFISYIKNKICNKKRIRND